MHTTGSLRQQLSGIIAGHITSLFPYKVAVYQKQLGRVTTGGDLGHVKGSGVGKFDCEYIEDGWEWY